MIFQGFAFFLAALYWMLTALYGVMASQAFIQEQFLAPRLLPPLAFFADWHAAIGVAMLAPWAAVRLFGERNAPPFAGSALRQTPQRAIAGVLTSAASLALISIATPLSSAPTATTSLTTVAAALVAMTLLAVAEWTPSASSLPGSRTVSDRSVADLVACLLAAVGAAVAQLAATLVVNGGAAALYGGAQSLRLHLLLGLFVVLRRLLQPGHARKVVLNPQRGTTLLQERIDRYACLPRLCLVHLEVRQPVQGPLGHVVIQVA